MSATLIANVLEAASSAFAPCGDDDCERFVTHKPVTTSRFDALVYAACDEHIDAAKESARRVRSKGSYAPTEWAEVDNVQLVRAIEALRGAA